MNFEFFIAKRIIFNKEDKNTISSPIIKIAISAIALGLIMMLIAIATGTGLQKKIQEKIASLNGHIQIYNYDTNRSDVSVTPIDLYQDFYPKWDTIFTLSGKLEHTNTFKNILNYQPRVTHIQPVITKGGIIRTEKTFEGIIAKGVGKDYDWQYMKTYLTTGRLPNYSTSEISNEILISDYLANRLALKVGDSCNTLFLREDGSSIPNQRNFHIVGTYNSGFQQFDATYIITDIRQLQRINKWNANQIGMFEVFINDFDQMQVVGDFIYGNIHSTLDSQTIAQKYQTIFDWFHTFNLNIIIIIGIMILVGGVNMITAILVLILERTPMIGILKALGTTNWSIRKIFLYNAGYLIGLGLFWGNIIGLGLLFLQKYFSILKLNPNIYYVSEVPINISPLHIILLNIGIFTLCLLMLLIPSYIITKISPIKAIKFE
ncbi:ABC transporter permease [Capnocytophaga catalasegens]|uniref:Permease n=1 Tax=Capnocytophaga catalasegens TaxID=1004260 RepID=A0AAV5AYC2_9FLAO|nr:FtsX-like permease family protein [Capnocytophaga catalasegens]GIZ15263.1 permease [Capnocytophaga catalasegens]GJM49777.1 permease [Capnocytophaga catalasegens]GJM52842.1 permease [Capnocytophaga catalasegens]